LVWNTEEIIAELGGRPVMWKAGHAFLKEKMREEDAVYGGEMSAHHYFRDFSYCDSGMIPWLLVAQLLSEKGRPLSELVAERAAKYPVSGEINRRLANPDDAIARLEARYGGRGRVEKIDGLSVAFDDWRFNVRKSNTEPLLRLNVETRGDRALLEEKTAEVLAVKDEAAVEAGRARSRPGGPRRLRGGARGRGAARWPVAAPAPRPPAPPHGGYGRSAGEPRPPQR